MTADERQAQWFLNFSPPQGWQAVGRWGDGWALQKGGLRLLVDCSVKADGRAWVHVSVSRKHGVPSYDELAQIKAEFIGDGRYAYFVFPPQANHVNLHRYCLHLWALEDGLDGRALPEFSSELEGIGRSI